MSFGNFRLCTTVSALAIAGAFMASPAFARCVNQTAGGVEITGPGQIASNDSVVCDAAAPNPSNVTINVGSGVTGVAITIDSGAIIAPPSVSSAHGVTVFFDTTTGGAPSGQASIINNGAINVTGASSDGINASRTATNVTNSGTIQSANGAGVSTGGIATATIVDNLATGRIIGTIGVATSSGTLINEGLIQGTTTRAINSPIGGAGADSLAVINRGAGILQGFGAAGTSTVALNNGNDSFTSAGTSQVLQTAVGGTVGQGVVDGGSGIDTFIFERSAASTISHGITNFENLTQRGADVVLDTNVALLTAGSVTTVEAGKLTIAATRTLTTATANLIAGSTLEINGTLTGAGVGVGGLTTITGSSGGETLIVNGTLTATANLGDGSDVLVLRDNAIFSAGAFVNGGTGSDTVVVDIATAKTQAPSGFLPSTVTGFENLTKQGVGTLTLTGANSFTAVALNGGVTEISTDANLGAAGGTLSFDGGTLRATASLTSARATTLNAGGGTIDIGAGLGMTQSGAITGAGALTKTGAGELVLTADNSYTGGTTIAAGTLQLGNGGTTGSITGNVVNNGTLIIDRSNNLILDGVISGSGLVAQLNLGVTTLTGDNTYTGGTIIAGERCNWAMAERPAPSPAMSPMRAHWCSIALTASLMRV